MSSFEDGWDVVLSNPTMSNKSFCTQRRKKKSHLMSFLSFFGVSLSNPKPKNQKMIMSSETSPTWVPLSKRPKMKITTTLHMQLAFQPQCHSYFLTYSSNQEQLWRTAFQIKKEINIPRSQTWNLILLYCTVSTLNPIAATMTKTNPISLLKVGIQKQKI